MARKEPPVENNQPETGSKHYTHVFASMRRLYDKPAGWTSTEILDPHEWSSAYGFEYPADSNEYNLRTMRGETWAARKMRETSIFNNPSYYYFAVYEGELMMSVQHTWESRGYGLSIDYKFTNPDQWGDWHEGVNTYWINYFTGGDFHALLGFGTKPLNDIYFAARIGVF